MRVTKAPIVVIESPFKGTENFPESANEDFLRFLLRHYALLGFNPIASHGYYPHFLDDLNHNERHLGIQLGLQLASQLRPVLVVFALRAGEEMSSGMNAALEHWKEGDPYGDPISCQLTRWTPTITRDYVLDVSVPL